MTSNIGSRQLKEFGQGVDLELQRKQTNSHAKGVIKHSKKAFAPEFKSNDDVILFNS